MNALGSRIKRSGQIGLHLLIRFVVVRAADAGRELIPDLSVETTTDTGDDIGNVHRLGIAISDGTNQ